MIYNGENDCREVCLDDNALRLFTFLSRIILFTCLDLLSLDVTSNKTSEALLYGTFGCVIHDALNYLNIT